MQTQAEIPPAQPAAPAPPAPAVIRIEGVPGVPGQTISIPLSLGDVRWLRARGSELSDQLARANNRRDNITDELGGSTGANRAGLELRLTQLDQRIVQLESEIAQTERILTSAPTGFLAAAERAESGGGDNNEPFIAIPVVFTLFVLFPIAIAYARRIWKRSPAPRALPQDTGRLERIEQAVEAIAVEVERVSEGQRFVTKLMSEGKALPVRDQTRIIPGPQRADS